MCVAILILVAGELLLHFFEQSLRLSLHSLGLDVDGAALLVVKLAVHPDLLDVCRKIGKRPVVALLQPIFDSGQVHRLLNYSRIVPQLERLPRHWLKERLRVRVLAQLCKQQQ